MNGSILIPEKFKLNGKVINVIIDNEYCNDGELNSYDAPKGRSRQGSLKPGLDRLLDTAGDRCDPRVVRDLRLDIGPKRRRGHPWRLFAG